MSRTYVQDLCLFMLIDVLSCIYLPFIPTNLIYFLCFNKKDDDTLELYDCR